MKREFLTGMSQIEIHRYLRRIKASLIRMVPKRMARGSEEAYVVLYILN